MKSEVRGGHVKGFARPLKLAPKKPHGLAGTRATTKAGVARPEVELCCTRTSVPGGLGSV